MISRETQRRYMYIVDKVKSYPKLWENRNFVYIYISLFLQLDEYPEGIPTR